MCKWGDCVDVAVMVPAELSHNGQAHPKIVSIDRCIAPIVEALNRAGILTSQSCCGHGQRPGEIMLHDGRVLVILSDHQAESYRSVSDASPEEKKHGRTKHTNQAPER